VGHALSAEDPESLRGPQFHAAWADEFCVWRKPGETLALLRMGLRLGDDPRLVVTTTPKPIAALRRLKAEASCACPVSAPTRWNADRLAPGFLEGLTELYGGTRLAAQELEGLLVEADGAALWRAADLLGCRGARPAALERTVVAVDPPAGTSEEGREGSACGIVAAGRLEGRAYVLADRSAAGLSPLGWARRAAEAAEAFGAAQIVAEANQGGDMVRAVLASARARTPVKLVRASRGKRARAEPVAALYEQGRVTHCGAFAALEEELTALGAAEGDGEGRLDRADALVWAVSALLLERPASEGPRAVVL
jgi:phage terminase large subunit-like protein